jgi:hypothetical protein
VFIFKVTEPSPLQDSSACAKRAAYPDPPPVVPHPESIAAQAAYRGRHSTIARLSPGSHIVNRGTPVAPLGLPQLNVPVTVSVHTDSLYGELQNVFYIIKTNFVGAPTHSATPKTGLSLFSRISGP